jgi:anaphase-promoting complex subunit 10
MIQIAVISNHQNGRDTHMRQIKVHSPSEDILGPHSQLVPGHFLTNEFQRYAIIR